VITTPILKVYINKTRAMREILTHWDYLTLYHVSLWPCELL